MHVAKMTKTHTSNRSTLSYSLKGALPGSFGKLTNLQYLRLGSNVFSGSLKPFDDLKSIIHLDLSGKDRCKEGKCSTLFIVVKSCTHLHMYLLAVSFVPDNNLVGSIPKTFLNGMSARRPIEVDLSSNSLSGGVPVELDR